MTVLKVEHIVKKDRIIIREAYVNMAQLNEGKATS